MGWGQILGGAAGFFLGGPGGAAVGSGLGAYIDQDQANQYNSGQAADLRAWQERMAGSAYQRSMADMRAAGLNPMLAYSQGGASVPTGAMAQWTPNVDSTASSAAGIANSESNRISAEASAAQVAINDKMSRFAASKILQEISNLETDQQKAKAMTENLLLEASNIYKQGLNLDETRIQIQNTVNLLKGQLQKANADTLLTLSEDILKRMDIQASQDLGNVGREMGQLKPIIDMLVSILRVSK